MSPNELNHGLGFVIDAKGVKRNPKCVRSLRRGAPVCEARPFDTCLALDTQAACGRNFQCVWTKLAIQPLDPSQPSEFCAFRGLYGLEGAALAATDHLFHAGDAAVTKTVIEGSATDLGNLQAFNAYIEDVEDPATKSPVSYAPRPADIEEKVPAPITEAATGLFAVVKEYADPECDCMLT